MDTTCYFFFDDRIDGQNRGSDCSAAIVHQLLRQKPHLIPPIRRAQETKSTQWRIRFDVLWEILEKAVEANGNASIILLIDALDECEVSSRDNLIQLISSLVGKQRDLDRSSLKVLMTSRNWRGIEDRFKGVAHIRLKAEDYHGIHEDVSCFIREQALRMQNITGCPDAVRKSLESELIAKADNTFLWASLVLEQIMKSTDASSETFEGVFQQLPKRLEDLYDGILGASPEPAMQKKILAILVAARRPLTLKEVNIALAIQATDCSESNFQRRLQFDIARRLNGVCGAFIRITNSKDYLIHQTAKKYLLGSRQEDTDEDVSKCDFGAGFVEACISTHPDTLSSCANLCLVPRIRSVFKTTRSCRKPG
jgi:hypothetical protein